MKIILILLSLLPILARTQPNCNAFLYRGDTLQYRACKLVENIDDKYYQFSKEFQEAYDEALKICPYFSYAYREKSVAYLKSGDFLTWKELMDKAVQYDQRGNLGYRGWCRYQFFRDYAGAIADIEKLDSLVHSDIGTGSNGDYNLDIAKAICYSALGQKDKAVRLIEEKLKEQNYHVGLYDYYQLGVIYFELKDYDNALRSFNKQIEINNLAEPQHYIAEIYKLRGDLKSYGEHHTLALSLFESNRRLFDPYTHHSNALFRKDYD